MLNTIHRGPDGRLRLYFESTAGFPALHMAREKWGVENLNHAAAEALAQDLPGGDAVAAFVQNSPVGRQVVWTLGLHLPKLPPSGYRIEAIKRQATTLIVVGGDLFGMLAGLADLALHSDLTARALLYRGGAKTEKPAFPLRYYWTWDHSTNWVLDDPGNQMSGAKNHYLKRPGTFVEDYRRLVDHCVEMRFNGIVIWGFLRAAHGGEASAYEVARYAADRGVAILPGLGTTGYGGVFYEGRHPYNLETFLLSHPRLGNRARDGQISRREISPHHPQAQDWIRRGVEWLYRSFPIGGSNMENNDFMVDYSPAGKRGRAKIRSGEADPFKDQYFAYKTALDAAHRHSPTGWNLYATYSGFGRGRAVTQGGADMGVEPYFAKHMPPSAVAQWTLSDMIRGTIPLRAWMEHPRPAAAYENPKWPKGLRPPTPRSAGFVHQASVWTSVRRTDLALSAFAEACLRGHDAGLEGISVHGEVTSRPLAWKLNYLAMRHWTYHPVSSLAEFADVELAPRLGGEKEARLFVEVMADLEEGKLDPAREQKALEFARSCYPGNARPDYGNLSASRMWEELLEWDYFRKNRRSIAQGVTHLA